MTTLLVILWIGVSTLLTLHWSVRISRSSHSRFELKRRNDKQQLRREALIGSLEGLRDTTAVLLAVVIAAMSLALWQGWGVIVALVAVCIMRATSRLRFVQRFAQKIYDAYEPRALNILEKYPLLKILAGAPASVSVDQKLESVEQLLHLVETTDAILSEEQEAIITHGITWHTTEVGSIMTKAKDIVSIKHSELLGPLVLDDLHRSGHTRFPVIRGTIDTIVGTLDISQQLDMSTVKRSETTEKVMSGQVLRIESDETLPAALDLLRKSHLHMLIVVDAEGKTVGLLTLSDITESLLGKNRGGVL